MAPLEIIEFKVSKLGQIYPPPCFKVKKIGMKFDYRFVNDVNSICSKVFNKNELI